MIHLQLTLLPIHNIVMIELHVHIVTMCLLANGCISHLVCTLEPSYSKDKKIDLGEIA